MIVPARRWYLGALAIGAIALLMLFDRRWALAFVLANVVWLLMLALDGWRVFGGRTGQVTVERDSPPAFSVGRAAEVRWRWTNRLDRHADVEVREEVPDLLAGSGMLERKLRLRRDDVTTEMMTITPIRRGKAETGSVHLRVAGPLGLAWRQIRLELPWKATVYPVLESAGVGALAATALRRREAGSRRQRQKGEGRAFESLREWVPGDEPRIIDWKATARRGRLMAREYEDERRQQVMIMIDAGRLLASEHEGESRLESAIRAALELAGAAVREDDDVGCMVFADRVMGFLPPTRGRRAIHAVAEMLAGVEGRLVEPDYPAAFARLAARGRKRALTVLFTDAVDRSASDAMLTQAGSLRPRHLPLVVALRDPVVDRAASMRPESAAQAFERAAAEELMQARAAALEQLRSRGIIVLDVPARAAAEAVVRQYQLLKRRGAI